MTNTWWEINVFCDLSLEDTVFWRLEKFGCRGTSSEVKGSSLLMQAYLPSMEAQLLDLAALSLWLRQDALCSELPIPAVQWHLIDEEDWASSWKKYWEPQEIGDRFLVSPAWFGIPEHSNRLLLRLDPGMAFGTGTHATTQLCLEALEMRLGTPLSPGNPEGGALLVDIGCGSGILSIGALLLGARKAYGVDTDHLSVRASLSNRELNKIDPQKFIVQKGSIDQLKSLLEEPVDGIVCNILAEVIIDLIPQWEAIAKPTTWAILSGILLDQAKPIADTLEQHGWIVAALWKRQDWCCFNVRRS